MVLINKLCISELSDKIEVEVTTEVGSTFTKVLLWNSSTYQDPAQAIDVSHLLTATSEVETFDIPASDLGVINILGLWFVEFTTDEVVEETDCCQDNVRLGMVSNFTNYLECVLNGLLRMEIEGCGPKLKDCDECSNYDPVLASTLLQTLFSLINFGYIEDALSVIEKLDEMCEICNTCPDYGTSVLLSGGGHGVFNNVLKQY